MRKGRNLPPGVYQRGRAYLVRVRRNGIAQTATLPTLEEHSRAGTRRRRR